MGSLSAPLYAQSFAHIDQLFFSQGHGGANPQPQILTVTSTGPAFSFSASARTSSGGDWLAVSGGENCCMTPAPVSVTVSPSAALEVGNYSGEVVLIGDGTSLIVNVTLVVAPPGGAVFDHTPGQLSFSMKPGGQPPSQVMQIGNAGAGTLNWKLIGSTFNGADFFKVSAETGTAPTRIALTVRPENLPKGGAMAGVYTGQLLFLSGSSTVTVPISVSVGDAELDRINHQRFAKASSDARSTLLAGGTNFWPANTINVVCGGFGDINTAFGGSTTAPDGTNTAKLIYEANPSSGLVPHYEYLFQDLGVGQQTLSFHFKAGGDSWVYISSLVDGVEQRVWFNLVGNGAVGSTVPAGWTAQIASLGAGWYRCAVTFNVTQFATYNGFGLATADQQVNYIANIGSGVYQWGQQFEHGPLSAYQANVGPCLAFTKTPDASSVAAGSPIGYTIALSNNAAPGTGAATAAALNDPLPAGTGINWSVSPAYGGPGTCAITGAVGSQTLVCNLGDLAGGGTASVRVASATSGASCAAYSNTATASATNVSSVQASATTSVQCASLSISKSHTGNFIQSQAGATYSVTVSNANGAGPTGGTVTVTETVPSGMTLVSMAGTGWTCPAGGTTCTRSDSLNGGLSFPAITVTVNVASNAGTPLTNSVSVSGGGSPNNSTGDSTVINANSLAVMNSPTPGTTLSASSATFAWSSTVGADQYWLDVGLSPGNGGISAGATTSTSQTVTGLPCDGRTLYVQLYTHISGAWQVPQRYTYTTVTGCNAQIVSPVPLTTLPGTTATFTWSAAAGADQYWLDVGSSLASGGISAGATTSLSRTVAGLPCDGRTLYVQLYTHLNSAWQVPQRYTYTAPTVCGTPFAQIVSPVPLTTLPATTATFTWSAAAGADQYWLDVGSSAGVGDISAGATPGTSRTVTGLPCDGRTLYVQLYTHLNGAWQVPQRYTYVSTSGCTASLAQILSPAPLTTLSATTATFTWNTAAGADQYWLDVGSSLGNGGISAGATTNLSRTVAGLPCDGRTLYVQLYTHSGGAWQTPLRYTYTAPLVCTP